MYDEIKHVFPEIAEAPIASPIQGETETEANGTKELLLEIKDLKILIKNLTKLMEAEND